MPCVRTTKGSVDWDAYTALAEYGYAPEELLEYGVIRHKDDEIATRLTDAKKERGRKKGWSRAKLEAN
jgi:hypothetical protein